MQRQNWNSHTGIATQNRSVACVQKPHDCLSIPNFILTHGLLVRAQGCNITECASHEGLPSRL